MHTRPGHLWSAWATPAAMPHLLVPPPCRRTTHRSDRTSARLSPLASPLSHGRGSCGAENSPSVLIKHDAAPSWSAPLRTPVLQLPLSLHFPKDADVRIRVIHHQNRSLPRHHLKQLPHQRALLRPRIGKKHANVGDGDLHAVVAQSLSGLGGVVVVSR